MKIKVLSRNPDDYIRETKRDIFKVPRNYAPELHPFQESREYVRALNATKLERVFAKPFLGALAGHSEGVACLAKPPRALSLLLSGSYDGEVRIWDLPRKTCKTALQAHSGWVRGICVEPMSGETFLSVGDDKLIKHWPLVTELEADKEYPEPLHSVVSKDTTLDVSHSWKKAQFVTCGDAVNVWDHHRPTPIRAYNWGVDTVYKVGFSPIETEIMAGVASDRGIILYDSREQVPLRKVVMKLRSNAVVWNPMEAFVFAVASEDYNVYSFDMRKLETPLNIHMDHTEAVMDLDYAPTGREIVSGSYDRSVRIFPCHKGRSREIYHTKRMQKVMCVSWSLDNKFLVSGSDEMNLRVWKANASEKLGPLRPREARAFEYAEKLKEKFGHHPDVRRIARHRQVPKHIRHRQQEHRLIKSSQKRKEANRRANSRPSAVPYVPERRRPMVGEVDD